MNQDIAFVCYYKKNYPYKFELVTITPRDVGDGTVLGFAQSIDIKEFQCQSKENLEQIIITMFGGQVAEEIIFNNTYTGVTSDLKQASTIARAMITQYGMNDKLLYSNNKNELSEEERNAVENILQECKEKCRALLNENKHLLIKLARTLVTEMTLTRNEVLAILELNH